LEHSPLKVALIGDVHANLPALEAVLHVVEEEDCGMVLDTGDVVGYGPFPNEVLQRSRESRCFGVRGNYDRWISRFGETHRIGLHESAKADRLRERNPVKHASLRWTFETLTELNMAYITGLPKRREIEIDGALVVLLHGSIVSGNEGLRSTTPAARLRRLATLSPATVFVSGHSHDPFIRMANGKCFINPGSVGRPGDGDYRPSFAIAEITADGVSGDIRRVDYDIDAVLKQIRAQGLPPRIAEMFRLALHPSLLPSDFFLHVS